MFCSQNCFKPAKNVYYTLVESHLRFMELHFGEQDDFLCEVNNLDTICQPPRVRE